MVSVTQLILTLFFKVTQEIFIIGSKKPQVVENKVAFRFPRGVLRPTEGWILLSWLQFNDKKRGGSELVLELLADNSRIKCIA